MKKVYIIKFLILISFLQFSAHAQLVLDSIYAPTGYVYTPDSGNISKYGGKILELDNGSVLIAGSHANKVRVWKLKPNGTLDSLFGTNGIASNPLLDLVPGYHAYAMDIKIAATGNIYVLFENGITNLNYLDSSKYAISISCFKPNGQVENTFGTNGYIISKPDSNYEYMPKAMDIGIGDDDKEIYVGGFAAEKGHVSCPAGFGKWFLCKYDLQGNLDISFNNTGYMLQSSAVIKQGNTMTPMAVVHDIRIMPDRDIICAGVFNGLDQSYFSFKMSPTGQFVNTYGSNGRCAYPVTHTVASNDLSEAHVLKDGSCILHSILRYVNAAGVDSSNLNIVRVTPNGMPDNTFGNAGTLNTFYYSFQYTRLLFKSDNSFLLSYYRKYGTDQKIEFMRFSNTGIQDLSFGTGGICKIQVKTPDNFLNPSQVNHFIWNKNETGLYAVCYTSPPTTLPKILVVKLKWPGLTPLKLQENEKESNLLKVYPNPVNKNQIITLQSTSNESIHKVEMRTMLGAIVPIEINKQNQHIYTLTMKNEMASGLYWIICEYGDLNKHTQSRVIKVD